MSGVIHPLTRMSSCRGALLSPESVLHVHLEQSGNTVTVKDVYRCSHPVGLATVPFY
jgi:hypothetical protein